MRIKQHDRSHIVELSDGSTWRIWPGDVSKTLQWRPTTELDVVDIEDEICTHALAARADGSHSRPKDGVASLAYVRVISANEDWPADAVRRVLREG